MSVAIFRYYSSKIKLSEFIDLQPVIWSSMGKFLAEDISSDCQNSKTDCGSLYVCDSNTSVRR